MRPRIVAHGPAPFFWRLPRRRAAITSCSATWSTTGLPRAIGTSIKAATELLEQFVAEEIAVEVTHRSARRLFGLAGFTPVREVVRPP